MKPCAAGLTVEAQEALEVRDLQRAEGLVVVAVEPAGRGRGHGRPRMGGCMHHSMRSAERREAPGLCRRVAGRGAQLAWSAMPRRPSSLLSPVDRDVQVRPKQEADRGGGQHPAGLQGGRGGARSERGRCRGWIRSSARSPFRCPLPRALIPTQPLSRTSSTPASQGSSRRPAGASAPPARRRRTWRCGRRRSPLAHQTPPSPT